ncbi:hypothetical protein ACA910_020650 [Epithemia clementina (nom. ined.)]
MDRIIENLDSRSSVNSIEPQGNGGRKRDGGSGCLEPTLKAIAPNKAAQTQSKQSPDSQRQQSTHPPVLTVAATSATGLSDHPQLQQKVQTRTVAKTMAERRGEGRAGNSQQKCKSRAKIANRTPSQVDSKAGMDQDENSLLAGSNVWNADNNDNQSVVNFDSSSSGNSTLLHEQKIQRSQ